MSVTLQLVLLVVFAFFAGHVVHRYASRYAKLSGVEYLLIGALVGPQLPPRLLTSASLGQLAPLISLLLGLAGFLVGLETRVRARVGSYSIAAFLIGALSLSALTVCFSAMAQMLLGGTSQALYSTPAFEWAGYRYWLHIEERPLEVGVVLAAAAIVTFSSTLAEVPSHGFARRAPVFSFLCAVAWWGQVWAVVSVGCVLALTHEVLVTPWWVVEPLSWLGGSLALGVVFGVLFTLFVSGERSTNRIFLATVGTVTIGAGIGAALGVSAMFVNLICGATVALISKRRLRLQEELRRLRQPIYVMLLILVGALWSPPEDSWIWLLPFGYVACRWLVRRSVPSLVMRVLTPLRVDRVGQGLIAQGTLAVAVAADYSILAPQDGSLVLTTVLVGTLVFDMFSARSLSRLLIDEAAEHSEVSQFQGVEVGS